MRTLKQNALKGLIPLQHQEKFPDSEIVNFFLLYVALCCLVIELCKTPETFGKMIVPNGRDVVSTSRPRDDLET